MRAWWTVLALTVLSLSGCLGDHDKELEPKFAPQGAPGVDLDDLRERVNETRRAPVCGFVPEVYTNHNGTATNGTQNGTDGAVNDTGRANGTANGTDGNASEPQTGSKTEEAGQDPSGNGSGPNGTGAATTNGTVNTTTNGTPTARVVDLGISLEVHEVQDCFRIVTGNASLMWEDLVVQIDTHEVLDVRFNDENTTRASRTAHVLRPTGPVTAGDQFIFCSTGNTARNVTVAANHGDAMVAGFDVRFDDVARC